MRLELPRLYPIVDIEEPSEAEMARAKRLAVELARAGAAILQLRAKRLTTGALTALAAELVAATRQFGCRLLVNDRADVAVAVKAAGVHLGDTDLPPEQARRILGAEAIIGLSTHRPEEAAVVAGNGADYLGFGPVFDSPTKAGVRQPRGLERLAEACHRTASRSPAFSRSARPWCLLISFPSFRSSATS